MHKLLPDDLKFYVVPNIDKTLSRVAGCATAAVVAKYHEKLTVINLIISKWVNKNLHNQLITLYKTQKDGLIIYNLDHVVDNQYNRIDTPKF